MTDFSWTAQHKELPLRPIVLPALERAGYQPVSDTRALERPRTILATADQRARAELIGPEDVIFKAALLLAPDSALAAADLRDFLAALLPGWQDAESWVGAALAGLGERPEQATSFGSFEITLKAAGRARLVLGVTWKP
ncbi:MAG TPA: hypothetical protein VGE07_30850 [Herpetosiphonaceae bacterium]